MIKVYKTLDLSDSDWKQIVDGFNRSFSLNKTVESMKKYYTSSITGYSYHALDYTEDGVLRGYNSIVPTEYKYKGQSISVGISGGTFVNKEFRSDVFIFKHLMDALFDYCGKDGMVMKVGVPNNNSFRYTLKMNKAKLVGYLNYYILPIRLFNVIHLKPLGFLNFIPVFISKLYLYSISAMSSILNSHGETKSLELVCDKHFYDTRYRNRNHYTECLKGNMIGFYCVVEEDGMHVAYIMDFKEDNRKSLKALSFVSRQILSKEQGIDAIMYVGTMNMRQPLLFKVPHKMDPKPLPLTVNVINGDMALEGEALNMNSWDFSLQNFDVR